MVDYLLRRGRYDPARTGRYPRRGVRQNGGIHWPAIIAHALGMVASLFWNNAAFAVPSYVGPISNHFPGLQGGTSAG